MKKKLNIFFVVDCEMILRWKRWSRTWIFHDNNNKKVGFVLVIIQKAWKRRVTKTHFTLHIFVIWRKDAHNYPYTSYSILFKDQDEAPFEHTYAPVKATWTKSILLFAIKFYEKMFLSTDIIVTLVNIAFGC